MEAHLSLKWKLRFQKYLLTYNFSSRVRFPTHIPDFQHLFLRYLSAIAVKSLLSFTATFPLAFHCLDLLKLLHLWRSPGLNSLLIQVPDTISFSSLILRLKITHLSVALFSLKYRATVGRLSHIVDMLRKVFALVTFCHKQTLSVQLTKCNSYHFNWEKESPYSHERDNPGNYRYEGIIGWVKVGEAIEEDYLG